MKLAALSLVLILQMTAAWSQTKLSRAEEYCAILAAHPVEGLVIDGEPIGVPLEKIVRRKALRACKKAHRRASGDETKYRLARAYLAEPSSLDDRAEAREMLKEVSDAGYAPAQFTLGAIWLQSDPSDAALAAQYFELARDAGLGASVPMLAYALGFGENTMDRRDEAVALYHDLGPDDPKYMLYGAEVLMQDMGSAPKAKKAASMLETAVRRGIPEAILKLLTLYSSPQSVLKNSERELKTARHAIQLGYSVGYESWVREYSKKTETYHEKSKTFQFATEGADAGNPYSAYIAGKMLWYGSGTKKNAVLSAQYLEFAANNGHAKANRLLNGVVATGIKRLKDIPAYSAQTCVDARRDKYDPKNTDYYNKCNHGINVLVCSRHLATELWSLLDKTDREYCTNKYISGGRYIGNFYGADKQSSVARKAISNVSVRITACHPPLKPKRTGNTPSCVE